MLFVYGNHDDEVERPPRNRGGLSQLLPDGVAVCTGRDSGAAPSREALSAKQTRWKKAASAPAANSDKLHGLCIGGVHGIPSSKEVESGSLWKKRSRDIYFRQVGNVCSDADVAVVHSNPKLPGQDEVEGPDGPALFRAFMQGSAKLLVHGHMHTREVVTVINDSKVVVNSDCRVVILLPGIPELDASVAAELLDDPHQGSEALSSCLSAVSVGAEAGAVVGGEASEQVGVEVGDAAAALPLKSDAGAQDLCELESRGNLEHPESQERQMAGSGSQPRKGRWRGKAAQA